MEHGVPKSNSEAIMVETRLTPGRSSDRLFDESGSLQARTSLLAQTTRECTTTPTDARGIGSFNGSPSGTHLNPSGGPVATRAMSLRPRPPHSHCPIIQEERQWRRPDILAGGNGENPRLFATRWTGCDIREQASEIASDYHMLCIALRRTKFHFWLGTKSVANQEVIPGTLHLTQPAQPHRIVFREAYDSLHLFIQNALLKEFFEWVHGKTPIGDVSLPHLEYVYDTLIGNLGVALLSAGELGMHGALYADSISLAIVARLFALYAEKPAVTAERSVAALPNWRLRRVIDFIETHCDQPITLADLARTAGLSRMHFAAQFRKATGFRPHEYLLRQRVERAKIILATTTLPIAQVALTVGFSSQSHFTGVVKRLTGMTPLRWRELSRG
jgi:AraC family transcriptional regulator